MIAKFEQYSNDDKIKLINDLTEKEALNIIGYKDWEEFTPEEINKGFCEIWAKYFYENIGGTIMKTFASDGKMFSHVFIVKGRKYFDAEVPYGVYDIMKLPYIQRWLKYIQNETPLHKLRIEFLDSIEERTIEYINDVINRKKSINRKKRKR